MLSLLLATLALGRSSATPSGVPPGPVVSADVQNFLLTVRWNNNYTAVAKLSDDQKEYCIFSGKFLLDPESEVLVTGCLPDDDLSVQFQSDKFGDQLFTVSDGEIVAVVPDDDHENWDGSNRGTNGRFRRDDEYYDEYDDDYYGDYELVNEDFALLPALDDYEVDESQLPELLQLQINVYLDPAFETKHGSSSKAMTAARQILGQTSLLMKHSSLHTKIELVHGDRFYKSNTHLTMKDIGGDYRSRLPKLLKSPFTIGSFPVAHVYLTVKDPTSRYNGVAAVASICAKQPRALVNFKSVSTTSVTIAHELGHLFGMFHDFKPDKKTDRKEAKCGKGKRKGEFVLNYGNSPLRTVWSDCSNEDFRSYYFRTVFSGDSFCLKAGCSASEFQCDSGLCIPEAKRCDFHSRDCPRGEDETDCPFPETGCSSSQFQCGPGGKCIPENQRCDRIKRHCPKGEDEEGCDIDEDYYADYWS
eukprot:GFUD01039081.1.p1 GENE.GFUD01039081.1~~GFUD01039081.1.p1  ORF type:complete len:473 (+),score=87.93 GFUD01039081.1:249-1667(+)